MTTTHSPALDAALREIAEYLRVDARALQAQYDDVAARHPDSHLKWTHVTAAEWDARRIDESDPKAVMDFYATTPNYIFELMEYHSTDAKQRLTQTAIAAMKAAGAVRVCDYGAGIAQDSIAAAKAGLQATAADIPGRTFDFAQWRAKRAAVDVRFVPIESETPLRETYDAITCFEVLQHVVSPPRTVRHLRESLAAGGRLLVTTRFKGNYSLALKHNEELEGAFVDVVERAGFALQEKLHMWGQGERAKHLLVFRRTE